MKKIIDEKIGISKAIELIKAGELVAFQTETVYGLGADFSNVGAVEKIFKAKGRPQDNPLIVHIAKPEDVQNIAKEIPNCFYKLAEKFMPGPLTVVLKRNEKVPNIITANGDTVAVRVPLNPVVREIIEKSSPLAAPSANKSKHISPTSAKHVEEDLGEDVALILDGGDCKVGIESTVLDLTTETPTILRPGAVTMEMLSEIFDDVKETKNAKIKVAKSPGMKYTHYAPKCETFMATSLENAKYGYDNAILSGKNPVYICLEINKKSFENRNTIVVGKNAEDYAKKLYGVLRFAEKKYDFIILQDLGDEGISGSVMNRARKSAGHKFL